MSPNERCPECGSTVNLVRERTDIAVGKRSVSVDVVRYRCGGCGEAFYSPEQMDAAQLAASNEVRRQDGLLMPSQIQEIRSKYGLTQSQLEQLLGVGPKTVVRWERGTVFQNQSTDALLRVLDAVPEAVSYLAELHGVECSMATAFLHGDVRRADMKIVARFEPASRLKALKGPSLSGTVKSAKRIKLQPAEQQVSAYWFEEAVV